MSLLDRIRPSSRYGRWDREPCVVCQGRDATAAGLRARTTQVEQSAARKATALRELQMAHERVRAERDELLDALQPFAEWYEEADPLIGSSSAVFTHTVEFKRAHELVERDG